MNATAGMRLLLAGLAVHDRSHGPEVQTKFEIGEVVEYDPVTHKAQFTLPMVLDEQDREAVTGFIPCGMLCAGPGFGTQFTPEMGAQALIIYLDHEGFSPVAAIFMANEVDTPPFPDGKTQGWKDKTGSRIVSTVDGATAGDGAGGARVNGMKYSEQTTAGGHKQTMDDVAQLLLTQSAGGHKTIYDDAGRVLKHVSSGGLQTIMDDTQAEIAHVASKIALGGRYAALATATNKNALHLGHLTSFETALQAQRKIDMVTLTTALGPYLNNGAGALTAVQALAALAHIGLPSGSATVLVND